MDPFFSVVIATRNRPVLFSRALESVLAQSCSDTEVIVVNDGSAAEHQPEYERILSAVDASRVRAFCFSPRPQGHGASYARNFGAAKAKAPYLCFLDDDDCWTDLSHLDRARAVIADAATPVDLYLTNQAAFLQGVRKPGPIWIEDMPAILAKRGNRPDRHGVHTVTVDELLLSHGFCHLNTLIVRRGLYGEIGGMEETIRWEEDRDVYLRLIDVAAEMKYAPVTVARHNIPCAAMTATMATALSEIERRLFQLTVFDRARDLSRHPAIRAYGRRHKAYALKRIAESFATAGRHVDAAFYAREALKIGPTVKWAGYTAWRVLRSLAGPWPLV
jgi:GT2 family glycosyltransferase